MGSKVRRNEPDAQLAAFPPLTKDEGAPSKLEAWGWCLASSLNTSGLNLAATCATPRPSVEEASCATASTA